MVVSIRYINLSLNSNKRKSWIWVIWLHEASKIRWQVEKRVIFSWSPPFHAKEFNFPCLQRFLFLIFMEELSSASSELLVFNDNDLHVDDACDTSANILVIFLPQTCSRSYIISSSYNCSFKTHGASLSDHSIVQFKFNTEKPIYIKKEIV